MRPAGQATTEFALALLVLIPILLGITDLGRAFFDYVELSHAVNEGSRYAVADKNVANIKQETRRSDGQLELTNSDINVVCYAGAGPTVKPDCSTVVLDDTIRVSASTGFVPLTPYVGAITGNPWTLTASAKRTYQN